MSQVDRYKPYKGAAAGWGALIADTKNCLGSENALKNIRSMLLHPDIAQRHPLAVRLHPDAGIPRLHLAEHRAVVDQLVGGVTTDQPVVHPADHPDVHGLELLRVPRQSEDWRWLP